jgi:ankyrin repeat protein
MRAAGQGNLPVMDLLMQAGADCRHRDKVGGRSLLGTASLYGQSAAVKRLLLSAGRADLESRNNGGCTPLMETCSVMLDTVPRSRGHLAALEMLLEAGADPNAVGDDGGTALDRACRHGLTECARRLIKGGADAGIEWHSTDKESGDRFNHGTALRIAVLRQSAPACLAESMGHTELAAELPNMIQVQRKKQRNQARKQRKDERDRKARQAELLEPEPELDDLEQSELAALERAEGESKQGSDEKGGRNSPPVSPVNFEQLD